MPHDAHADHVDCRYASHVVRQSDLGILDLPRASLALELLVHLIHHAQAAGPDGMAEALQAAVGLTRYLAVQIEEPRLDVLLGLPARRDAQVLIGDKFG